MTSDSTGNEVTMCPGKVPFRDNPRLLLGITLNVLFEVQYDVL